MARGEIIVRVEIMARIDMRLDGRITSASRLQRELKRRMERHVEDSLRRAASPGVRMTRMTRDSYTFEGTPEDLERMKRWLQ